MVRRALGACAGIACATFALAGLAAAQDNPSLQNILERLQRLEQENAELKREVQSLREQVVGGNQAAGPTVAERLEVQEHRTEEMAQTKVEASQKLPITITGMALFNAFLNGGFNGAQENPTIASPFATPRTAGATFRQTVIGLQFRSPHTILGAQVNGSVYFDFFAVPANTQTFRPGNDPVGAGYAQRVSGVHLNQLARLRVATVEMDWKTSTLAVGQDKPIISFREPNSLAQVGVSPLTSAGNPWLWQPQIRFEQRYAFSENTDLRAQIGIFQTAETAAQVPEPYDSTLESSRPALEGRVSLHHAFSPDHGFEIAPGFHVSTTHVAGTSVPSRLYTLDWLITPLKKLEFTGMFFQGRNTANLGTLRQGFQIFGMRHAAPVHTLGGWVQFSYAATPRLTFNAYGGQQDDRNRDLAAGGIGRNFTYAGNAMFRIAPNVIVSFETMQIRTLYVGLGNRLNNRYDLALAYLF